MKHLLSITLAAALAATFTGCGGASEAPKQSNVNDKKESRVHLSLFDADAGMVNSDKIKLTFKGIGVEVNQQPVTTLQVSGDKPAVDLLIKSLPQQPKSLTIIAEAFGYNPASLLVIVPATGTDQAVTMKMVKQKSGKISEGIFGNILDLTGFVDENGKVLQEIVLLSKESGNKPGTRVKIPAGTVLTDKDGNPVTDGTLSVVSFDPTSPKALQAYPGGMNVLADATGFSIGGQPADGERQINFKSAGFAEIVIRSLDGRDVRHFSQPVEIAMQFGEGTKDADGKTIALGDQVPIWSYETDSGKWRYEKDITGTVSDADPNDGLYDVIYTTTHLSAWNLDWHYGEVCTANINVIDTLGANQLIQVDHFIVDIPGTYVLNRYIPNNDPSTGDMILYNVPAGYPATVTAYDNSGAILATQQYSDLCGGQTGPGFGAVENEVDLTIGGSNATVTDVNLTLSCPNNVNIPGTNSPTIPFDAVLTPVTSGVPVALGSDGAGQVAVNGNSENFTLTSAPAQQGYFSMIDWGNAGNPSSNLVTIGNSGSYTQNFVLSNAFCAPTTGTISGTELPNPDIQIIPRDVAKDAHGNLYVSTYQHGILKYDGQNLTTLMPMRTNASQPYPTATPVTINTSNPNVYTSSTPTGLDIATLGGSEFLFFADTKAHCVNAIKLDTLAAVTVAGTCGQTGGNTPGTDVSTSTTPVIANNGGKLNFPTDVAYFSGEKMLFITQRNKVKAVKVQEQQPTIWDVAGTGAIPPVTGYTDGALAATTPVNPYMLDVTPSGDIVMSDGGHMLSKISDINYAPAGNPATGAQLYRVTGKYMTPGDFTTQIPAADLSTRYYFTRDVEIDATGNIYFADHYNNRVRRILATTGEVQILAGFGGVTLSTLNQTGPVNVQSLWRPHGLWVEENGDFYLTQIAAAPYGVVRHVTY